MGMYFKAGLVILLAVALYFTVQYQDTDLVLRFYQTFGREKCAVLDGKTVWITGASSGIGEQLAYDFAECDCNLVLSARRKKKLEQVKDKVAGTCM